MAKKTGVVLVGAGCAALIATTGAPGSVDAATPASSNSTGDSAVPAWAEPVEVFPPPPAGVDLVNASDAQLASWGFPPRPTDPSALAVWTKAVRSAKHWVAPNPLASSFKHDNGGLPQNDRASLRDAAAHTTYTSIWAGWDVPTTGNGCSAFTETSSSWTQPGVAGNASYPNSNFPNGTFPDTSFWNGMGGINTGNLVQAGADSIATATAQYRFWTEDYPNNTIWEGPVIRPGDTAYASSTYNGNGTASYFLENDNTGNYSSFKNSAPYYDGSTMEFINEKLGGAPLPNYGSTTFNGPYGSGSGTCSVGLYGAANSNKIYMTSTGTSSGTTLVSPSAISNSNAFSVTWDN